MATGFCFYMLIITQNKTNKLVTTLTEKKVTDTTIYLFELVNQQTAYKFYCITNDVSNSKNRYNAFCISETSQSSGGTNPLSGQIALPLAGFYFYNVYENPDSVLSPAGLNEVETGKCLVIANKNAELVTYESAVNPKQVAYNPELFLK